jgi:hypothetical protein
MSKEITNKTWVVQTIDGVRIWITEEQKDQLLKALHAGMEHIILERRILPKNFGVYKPSDLEEVDKRKRGLWECKYHNWHSRNDICECGRR